MAIFPFFREISFAAFLISGILGSVNYYKSGNLDLKTAGVLSAGSFVGALAGVKINLLIPADTMKIFPSCFGKTSREIQRKKQSRAFRFTWYLVL